MCMTNAPRTLDIPVGWRNSHRVHLVARDTEVRYLRRQATDGGVLRMQAIRYEKERQYIRLSVMSTHACLNEFHACSPITPALLGKLMRIRRYRHGVNESASARRTQ